MNIQEQLAYLRRTVAKIDSKYEGPFEATPEPTLEPTFDSPALPPRPQVPVGELLAGEVKETTKGRHFETEKLFHNDERHGSYEISELMELRPDLLAALSDGAISSSHPKRWAFLDTETTGLAGGSGTCAFLIGLGSIDEDGFRVRQFFMRDFAEEASALHSLAEHLKRFDVLITYNGKSYDQPLLETRYTMVRARHPFAHMEHLDLLYGARRLFKLRLENCRLVNLENQILGVERVGDIPGEMIPYVYFEYLRTKRAHRLLPVFHHNVLDIVSLACLTGVIPEAFRDPANMPVRHGLDLLGLARWLRMAGRLEEALSLMRRAIQMTGRQALPDRETFRALYDAGLIEKKLGMEHAAVATFTELSTARSAFQVKAYEELAMHYEHRERNYPMALECVLAARDVEDSPALAARQARLQKKSAGRPRQARFA